MASYEKQNFTDGQILTADCLNRMEKGIKDACDSVPPVCGSQDCSKVLSYGTAGLEWVDRLIPANQGGYYSLSVSQVDATTLKISFTPSKTDMASIEDQIITLPSGKDGTDGKDGTNGKDGVGISSVTQTTTSTADGGTNIITVTKTDGTKQTFNIKNGSKGSKGDQGNSGTDGRGIKSVKRTSGNGSAGSTDVYTITFSDDTTSTFTVYNGANGKDGTDGSGGSGSGENGATFTPYVDSDGNLSWSNDKGLANPETVNIKGSKGEKGDRGAAGAKGDPGADGAPGAKGDPGAAATIKVGTVTTGAAGSKAAVTNSGTTSAAVFNFAIPKGDPGAAGTPGTDGKDGTNGKDGVGISSVEQTTTSTVSSGINWITVTKTDGTSNTFRVKNGAQGEKGDKGDPGAAGADGKSAYQYAKDGGYTGTETEFADKLAEDTATKAYVDGKRFTATATLLASGWGKSGDGYGYTLTIADVKSADYPHITPVYAGIADISLSKQQMDAWANVSAAAAGDGKIWFTAYEKKPTVDIKIQIEVIR